ncbi:zinc metalloproteinase nas-15-like [Tubulanus polymorphus]|uniref:zinc metalloproteinase nas-15-like n=1 Tax=Tubulanus polymorphus TaxID=672921 RepID=UPI003DA4E1CC
MTYQRVSFQFRSAVDQTRRWPNNTFNYDYLEGNYAGLSKYEQDFIDKTLVELFDMINKDGPCMKLRKIRPEDHLYRKDFNRFTKSTGCYSGVGYMRMQKFTSIGQGCLHRGTIMHEVMHRIGLWHEQSRQDRDKYITIHWENISPGGQSQFRLQTRNYDDLNTPYDYGSLMHYGWNFFSKNGKATMTSKKPGVTLGQRNGPTYWDIKKIRILYGCDPRPQ